MNSLNISAAGDLMQTGAGRKPSKTKYVASDESVRVFVRVRPMKDSGGSSGFTVDSNQINVTAGKLQGSKATGKMFGYDKVLDDQADQARAYNDVMLDAMDRFVTGFNVCCFSYGQTGSGKTWTMLGEADSEASLGLIPRALGAAFAYKDQHADEVNCKLTVSVLEIYNEKLRDLTREDVKYKLDLWESEDGSVYCQNLSEIEVRSVSEATMILGQAMNGRVVGETKMNEKSSRSHMVFTLTLTQIDVGDDVGYTKKISKLNMIDLAGSERQGDTGTRGARLKEGAQINLSLSSLGKVINALARQHAYIPYRESKLTRLLQSSLGGNSVTIMLATISSEMANHNETLGTLRFADRAKTIETKARINVDPAHVRLLELMQRNKELTKENLLLKKYLRENKIEARGQRAGRPSISICLAAETQTDSSGDETKKKKKSCCAIC